MARPPDYRSSRLPLAAMLLILFLRSANPGPSSRLRDLQLRVRTRIQGPRRVDDELSGPLESFAITPSSEGSGAADPWRVDFRPRRKQLSLHPVADSPRLRPCASKF